jgi:peroxiredoxin
MKTTLKTSFLIATALACAGGLAHGAAEVGRTAPDFTLTDSKGKTHSLSDFKGKHVVLEWINFECPFVKKHYKGGHMQNLQREFTGKDVVWLAICSSAVGKQGHMSPAEINETIKEKNAAMTAYLIDEDGKVGRAYGAKTTPHMFIVNPKGRLIYAGAIDSIRSANAGDVDKAQNYVKAALNEALAGKPVTTPQTEAYGCSVKYAK